MSQETSQSSSGQSKSEPPCGQSKNNPEASVEQTESEPVGCRAESPVSSQPFDSDLPLSSQNSSLYSWTTCTSWYLETMGSEYNYASSSQASFKSDTSFLPSSQDSAIDYPSSQSSDTSDFTWTPSQASRDSDESDAETTVEEEEEEK